MRLRDIEAELGRINSMDRVLSAIEYKAWLITIEPVTDLVSPDQIEMRS